MLVTDDHVTIHGEPPPPPSPVFAFQPKKGKSDGRVRILYFYHLYMRNFFRNFQRDWPLILLSFIETTKNFFRILRKNLNIFVRFAPNFCLSYRKFDEDYDELSFSRLQKWLVFHRFCNWKYCRNPKRLSIYSPFF